MKPLSRFIGNKKEPEGSGSKDILYYFKITYI